MGLHVGRYLTKLEEALADPESFVSSGFLKSPRVISRTGPAGHLINSRIITYAQNKIDTSNFDSIICPHQFDESPWLAEMLSAHTAISSFPFNPLTRGFVPN